MFCLAPVPLPFPSFPSSRSRTGRGESRLEELPSQELLDSVVHQNLVSEGKLGGTQSLEEYFSSVSEGEIVRDLQQDLLRHFLNQVQMGIQEGEREIAELKKQKK